MKTETAELLVHYTQCLERVLKSHKPAKVYFSTFNNMFFFSSFIIDEKNYFMMPFSKISLWGLRVYKNDPSFCDPTSTPSSAK